MRGRLSVSFQREEGIDAGGLTREWYVSMLVYAIIIHALLQVCDLIKGNFQSKLRVVH